MSWRVYLTGSGTLFFLRLDGWERVDGKRKIGRLILRLTAYGIIACGAQMKTKVNFMAKNLGVKLFIKK